MGVSLKAKNALVDELYDDVDTISEELIEGNFSEVGKAIDSLSGKLKHLKANIKENDEIS